MRAQPSSELNVRSSEDVIAIAFDTVFGQPIPQFVHAYTFAQPAGFLNNKPIHVFTTGIEHVAVRPVSLVTAFVKERTVY